MLDSFPYVWVWKKRLPERHGQRCALLIISAPRTMNNCLLQFQDGFLVITSLNGIRRAKPHD